MVNKLTETKHQMNIQNINEIISFKYLYFLSNCIPDLKSLDSSALFSNLGQISCPDPGDQDHILFIFICKCSNDKF